MTGGDVPDDRREWARAGIPHEDIEAWRSWRIGPAEARLWRGAGVTDALTAAQWQTAGVSPEAVEDWAAEDIDAAEAVRWHEWSMGLAQVKREKAAGRNPGEAQTREVSIRAAGGGAVVHSASPGDLPPLHRLLQAGNRFVHGYLERQWTDESAVAWARAHISVDDAYLWTDLGLTAAEAARLTADGHSPGQVIRAWWRTGIPFHEVAEWIGAGLAPDEAVAQRAKGVTVEHAAALRALRADEPEPTRDPDGSLLARTGPPTTEEPGPPPADVDAAKAAVVAAVEAMTSTTDEHSGLVHVDGGEDLGASLDETRRRLGATTPPTITVRAIRFVNDHQARVAYDLQMGSPVHVQLRDQLGGALLVDGVWKVTRETVVQLLARAGVTCPPRSDR